MNTKPEITTVLQGSSLINCRAYIKQNYKGLFTRDLPPEIVTGVLRRDLESVASDIRNCIDLIRDKCQWYKALDIYLDDFYSLAGCIMEFEKRSHVINGRVSYETTE